LELKDWLVARSVMELMVMDPGNAEAVAEAVTALEVDVAETVL